MEIVGYLMIASVFILWYVSVGVDLGYKSASLMVLGVLLIFSWVYLAMLLINGELIWTK